jgi:hypothetical protein
VVLSLVLTPVGDGMTVMERGVEGRERERKKNLKYLFLK